MAITEIKLPKVIFESGWLLDESIAEIEGSSLNDEAIAETSSRLPEFQESWDHLGPRLLEPVMTNFGITFAEQDIKAFLLCGKLHSQSHPLLINVKRYLACLNNTPDPMHEFVEVVFHELLHILLQDRLSAWPTPSIKQFEDENFEVQAHLHLMSLQKFSHMKSGRDIKSLEKWYGDIGPNYSRAWGLISDDRTFKTLLDEIPNYFTKNIGDLVK
ncbi:hypothetical protein ACLVWU_10665 [Bdellovibrio sp. HCB290]|uniref:hypothetical protein n=1 Tax=Bdellovibrio sp. HCB290 TaxID=3394356 RepID=UPI0039B49BF9